MYIIKFSLLMIFKYPFKTRREMCISQHSLDIFNWFFKMKVKTYTLLSMYEGSRFPIYSKTFDHGQL